MPEQTWPNNGKLFDQGGSGPIPPPPTPSPAANWDITLVRYIFLDGDNGDDSKLGYIDAAPGTVFAPGAVAAVAVKTTHRINEIRPPIGAGRMVVVLMKPRAGNASYDLLTLGDGLGSEDRTAIEDYALMHTRASDDLTNSTGDQAQLGFVTAIPGPNSDGSFTVANVTTVPNYGVVITLTGATLPAGWILSRYRIRVEPAAGPPGTRFYAPLKWGDANAIPDPTLALAWTTPSPITIGDKLWIEEPGLTLHDFFEASNIAVGRLAFPQLVLAGARVSTGIAAVGASEGDVTAYYTHMQVDEASGATMQPSNRGSIIVNGSYTNEAGATSITFGVGLWASGVGSALTAGENLEMMYCSFSSNDTPPSSGVSFRAETIEVINCVLQKFSVFCEEATLFGILTGPGDLLASNYASARSIQFSPNWGVGYTVDPTGLAGISAALSVDFASTSEFWGPPATDPAYILRPGIYTVYFDMDTPHAGAGTELRFDAADQTKRILVTYASLKTTGFEIEHGQRVVCRLSQQNYHGNTLPCPRGMVMRMEDAGEGGGQFVTGTVAGRGTLGNNRFDLARTTRTIQTLIGITLTNLVQGGYLFPNDGYAVVGNDGIMVVALTATLVTEPWNYPVYASFGNPGLGTMDAGDSTVPPWILGTVPPIGPTTGASLVCVMWRPGEFSVIPP